MITKELTEYVKNEITSGSARDVIKDKLIKTGWSEPDISEALGLVSPIPTVTSLQTSPQSDIGLTEKNYPISTLWVIKAPLIMVAVSAVLIIFGIWIPYFVIAVPFFLVANPLIRANFHFLLDDKYFKIKQGVLSKKERSLPYGVIQNIIIKQDLYDRIFKIGSLVVENASDSGGANRKFLGMTIGNINNKQSEFLGFKGNKVSIPGLSVKDAEKLKEIMLQKIKENPIDSVQSGL
jgi:membrane protein YdbS with pleckstrin-like domain